MIDNEKVTTEMDKAMQKRRISTWDIDHSDVDTSAIHAEACDKLGIELPNLLAS